MLDTYIVQLVSQQWVHAQQWGNTDLASVSCGLVALSVLALFCIWWYSVFLFPICLLVVFLHLFSYWIVLNIHGNLDFRALKGRFWHHIKDASVQLFFLQFVIAPAFSTTSVTLKLFGCWHDGTSYNFFLWNKRVYRLTAQHNRISKSLNSNGLFHMRKVCWKRTLST